MSVEGADSLPVVSERGVVLPAQRPHHDSVAAAPCNPRLFAHSGGRWREDGSEERLVDRDGGCAVPVAVKWVERRPATL